MQILTTTPGLAAAVREIVGDRAEVESLTRGSENMHAVGLRPSMLVKLKRADLLVLQGLHLEGTWLPDFLQRARNEKVAYGSRGYLDCGVGWKPIQVPTSLSRRAGDLHPNGNPHYNLDPRAGRHIAGRILERLVELDPEGRAEYEARHAAYVVRLAEVEARWAELAERTRGRQAVEYHQEFDYLFQALGIDLLGTVEMKPGVPPTPRHLADLGASMEAQEIELIFTAPWSNNRQVESLAERTGARVLELPTLVGAAAWAKDWISLMDGLQLRIAEAYGSPPDGE